MKKFFSFAVTAMAIFGLGSLTSCQDEDFDVSTAVLQERAFEEGFIKEFGKPSADQSWDFYAQMMESLRSEGAATRATMVDAPTIRNANQPGDDDTAFQTLLEEQIDRALKDGNDNSNVGQNTYSLVSTGEFKIYAVRYVGAIETSSTNNFRFGVAYINNNGYESRETLFSSHSVDSNNNPKLAKSVTFNKGDSFYFYIQYTSNNTTRRYYSNQTPYTTLNGTTYTYTNFGGTSTLLYSSEIDGKQYMIIGFEDAWGYGNNRPTGSSHPDYDFNDIVIVIEGELPVPTSKRFFCEDLQSTDWDYNDVVFDVTSRGVVLRAVGGTLPVRLQITDKAGDTWTSTELHELMWSKQSAEEQRKHPIKTFEKNGKTYYKPIRVGANPGLAIEAVSIGPVWDYPDMAGGGNGLALSDEEVIYFANPYAPADKKKGAVKLLVGTVDGEEIVTDAQTVVNDGFTVIEPYVGVAPAIWTAPSSVRWMNERVKITEGYPKFYGGGATDDPTTGGMPLWWSDVVLGNTYQFSGDVDPDRVN